MEHTATLFPQTSTVESGEIHALSYIRSYTCSIKRDMIRPIRGYANEPISHDSTTSLFGP